MVIQTNVPQHHGCRKNQSSWVGLILALDVQPNVTATRLENCDITSHVATGHNSWSTNKACANVGQDTTVKVGHDHDVELLWPAHTLHAGIVDDHVVSLERWVVF